MSTRDEVQQEEVGIDASGTHLIGTLVVPRGASGVVLFAHGSGSSRKSARNVAVARTLQEAGLATLLLDLLTPAEDAREQAGAMLRFDVQRLATRLGAAIGWLAHDPATRGLPLGLFGASTGAAVALIAAAASPSQVYAVVSRGGRPDLAGHALGLVACPTRLIVGGADPVVIGLNRTALQQLKCVKDLVVVPGATHLFEEPGALQVVARLAGEWLSKHLRTPASARAAGRSGQDDGRPLALPTDARSPNHADPRRGLASDDAVGHSPAEVDPPSHQPSQPRPPEAPPRVEPPYAPAPPPPSPGPSTPEFEPFRGMR